MDLDQVMQEMAYFLKAGEGQHAFDGRQDYQTLRLCHEIRTTRIRGTGSIDI